MKKKAFDYRRIYAISFFAALLIILMATFVFTDAFDNEYKKTISSFSEGWRIDSAEVKNIDEVSISAEKSSFYAEKALPRQLMDGYSLCFEADNINFAVFVGDEERYRFTAKENLSGYSYGKAFHMVGLCSDDATERVRIECEAVYEGCNSGTISDVYLTLTNNYIKMKFTDFLPGAIISFAIVFFGIVMIIIFLFIRDAKRLPFDILALGMVACVVGIWLLVDSKMFQLLTGAIYTCRALDKTMLFMAGFPLVAFFNSVSAPRRMIFNHISLGETVTALVVLVVSRFLFGIDMHVSYTRILFVYVLGVVITIIAIFVDNDVYCRANDISKKLRYIFVGNILLLSCAVVDLIIYKEHLFDVDNYGNFSRIGAFLFVIIMLLQFLNWWTKDQESIGRDRFVNKVMQYAISSDSSDKSIKAVLGFIGKEIKAGRAIIFEDQNNGKFQGVYDWYEKGRNSAAVDLIYLPYDGFVDEVSKSLNENEKKIIIRNVEDYEVKDFSLYKLLITNHVKNLVAGALEVNDRLIGILALLDVSDEEFDVASDIIGGVSYLMSQLLLRRDEEKRLRSFIYNDNLSGALNRRAFREFLEKFDTTSPFGYLICTIDGLENANDKHGYDLGDKMIITTTAHLMEVFGNNNVYRISGTELVAFGFESEELYFENDVERFKKLTLGSGVKAFVGGVYCMYGTSDINQVIRQAADNMEEDKKKETTAG